MMLLCYPCRDQDCRDLANRRPGESPDDRLSPDMVIA
jgi:hypothetical protein